MPKKRWLALWMIALSVGLFWWLQPPNQPPLRVGSNVWPGYEGLYLAKHQGYYQNTPIKVIAYPSATSVANAFRAGLLEAAALTLDEALLLASQGVRFKILMVFDESHGADAIVAHKGIARLAQLKGKKVALESSALGAYLLERALEKSGLQVADLKLVQHEVNEHEHVFLSHQVDAVVTFDPVKSRLQSAGGSVIFDSSQIPGEIVDVLVVGENYLQKHRAMVTQLLAGYFKAMDYQQANMAKAIEFLSIREGVSAKEYLASLQTIRMMSLEANRDRMGKNLNPFIEQVTRLQKVMLDHGLLEHPTQLNQLFDDQLIHQVRP